MLLLYVGVYNPFLVYCRELAPGTVSLTGDRAQGDDSKHDSHYTAVDLSTYCFTCGLTMLMNWPFDSFSLHLE